MVQSKILLHDFGRSVSNGSWGKNDVAKSLNRLYYVNSGEAVVYYAQKKHTLTAGNVYILPQSKDFYRVDAKYFDHIFFDYYCSPALQFDSFTEIPSEQLSLNKFFKFLNTASLKRRVTEDRAVALNFLTGILSYIELHIPLPYISDKIVVEALKLFEANPNITSAEIATKLNINESYFIRLFSKTMGTSPMKFNRTRKLSLSITLLENGYTISEIAEECGYGTVSAFGKAFRKAYGCSPGSFKELIKKKRKYN